MANDNDRNIQGSRKAAMSFLHKANAGEQRRNRIPKTVPQQAGQKPKFHPLDLSDEDWDALMKSGQYTPEQLRQAGEYDFDTYMGDVWYETDLPDQMPEPSYDEFMTDPDKYGYNRGINPETDRAFGRYKSTVKK